MSKVSSKPHKFQLNTDGCILSSPVLSEALEDVDTRVSLILSLIPHGLNSCGRNLAE